MKKLREGRHFIVSARACQLSKAVSLRVLDAEPIREPLIPNAHLWFLPTGNLALAHLTRWHAQLQPRICQIANWPGEYTLKAPDIWHLP